MCDAIRIAPKIAQLKGQRSVVAGSAFVGRPDLQSRAYFEEFRKRGLLEKRSFQKSPFSRDSRESRDSKDFREPPECGKKGGSDHFLEDSGEFGDFRDSRDSSSEKTLFVVTPLSGPEFPKRRSNDDGSNAPFPSL